MRKQLELQDYLDGIKNKNLTILARAITLVESHNPDHQKLAQELLKAILPLTGKSKRVGISGTPGVGKSTFIEAFGKQLTSQNKTVAVLAVDPTSQVSGGSILGDKTRMNELAIDPMAFIRPSPSGETLGGVARRTRESMLICEAYGFDYVLVETVGVGQSETTVAQMVDLFVMLLQPGAGDDLQGIKRGILEVVDMVVVTKDDGDQEKIILRAKHDYQQALQILRHDGWIPPVLSCSAVTKKGLPEVEKTMEDYFSKEAAQIQKKREKQGLDWMWQLIHEGLKSSFQEVIDQKAIATSENKIKSNKGTPPEVAQELLKQFFSHLK
ncbi:methylmalonyl Co-A mutase-associated GTPase MeaB [Peredibacter starrii]|uniref:Methylmalonyl Co-A mutase-associated GTPase MeaB n=1 Tax=Peredibacter starrii TaxID=28202 RepID=A0AAX4HLA4_9BACT|nr:methylmalonyl Co-A mutase-associated GTPase MeaB [Peredibacter starrii]WPU63976.1 methylmalonyl Co-A mutase-associated GTPase MeaB [Peredibacter starrii]